MSNKKKLKQDRTVHALLGGSKDRALCSKRSTQRVTDDPEQVTCDACGKAAIEALERFQAAAAAEAQAEAGRRQEAALAANAPLRWWETKPGSGDA